MGDSLLRQRPPKFGLMTLTSPSLSTQAEMMPLTGGMGEPGVFMRSANAVEGAASATAAKTTKDRKELVSIFSPSLRELRPCWQGLARRVNDTCVTASAVLGGEMVRPERGCAWGPHRHPGDPSARQFFNQAENLTNA